jgi:hypothetical protein
LKYNYFYAKIYTFNENSIEFLLYVYESYSMILVCQDNKKNHYKFQISYAIYLKAVFVSVFFNFF